MKNIMTNQYIIEDVMQKLLILVDWLIDLTCQSLLGYLMPKTVFFRNDYMAKNIHKIKKIVTY